MRKREEIENPKVRKEWKHPFTGEDLWEEREVTEYELMTRILEVLLDVRSLLMPPQPVVIKMTDEESREFMAKWKKATEGRETVIEYRDENGEWKRA